MSKLKLLGYDEAMHALVSEQFAMNADGLGNEEWFALPEDVRLEKMRAAGATLKGSKSAELQERIWSRFDSARSSADRASGSEPEGRVESCLACQKGE